MEFGNDFVRNVLILDVDNISSTPTYNRKNNFLVLGEGQTQTLIIALAQQKKVSINISEANTKFCFTFPLQW